MTQTPGAIYAAGLLVIWIALSGLWVVSLYVRDASIIDPFWAPGFLIVTITYLLVDGRFHVRGVLVLALVFIWAVRLGTHLWLRNRRSGEDPRYGEMRDRHGERFPWVSLFTVFWFQAVLLWAVSAPLLGAVVSDSALTALDLAGSIVFLIGFGLEALADVQLRAFTRTPSNKGRVLDTGLWRYSRHPNYFGNALLWWGLYGIAMGGGAFWTVFGPVLMTFLLLRVSGVTLLEKGLRTTRPGYAQYIERTSAFVPWPPSRGSAPGESGE